MPTFKQLYDELYKGYFHESTAGKLEELEELEDTNGLEKYVTELLEYYSDPIGNGINVNFDAFSLILQKGERI
jgi:hypothetical protein